MASHEGGAAAAGGGGGGIGGKFRKRPFRRNLATPYDRPATAARPALLPRTPVEIQRNGWLSKLVDPASRIITWSASRLLPSSVFQKRLGARLPEANRKSTEEVPKEPCSSGGTVNHTDLAREKGSSPTKENSSLKVQEQHVVDSCNASSAQQHGASSGVVEVFEIEQKFKQKTFTRAEFDRLTQFLHSRTVESIKPEVVLNCERMDIVNVQGQTNKQQCASEVNVSQPASSSHIEMAVPGQTNMHQPVGGLSQPLVVDEKNKPVALGQETGSTLKLRLNYATPAVGLTGPEEALSPTEVAKAYMRPRHLKCSPAALRMQDQLSWKDRPLPVCTPYAKKLSDSSVELRSAIDISGSGEDRPNSYMTPKLHGRSALYKMARSPYFQPRFRANLREDRSLLDGHTGPSTSRQLISANVAHSASNKMLKRGSSVLDDGIGSSSFTRRTRQKSNLTSHFDQGFITSNQKLLYQKNDTELEAEEREGPIIPVPPRSTEMARKILQQLDKMVTSPKERTSKLKIDMDESSPLLTHSMLHERAMKSMEEIDTSKFLDVQRNGSLDASSDFLHSQILGDTVPLKQDKAEENGLIKSAVKGVQFISKDSVLEKHNNISGTGTNPSVITGDFAVTGAATTSMHKKPSFQMSAPEDLAELDDDSDDINDSCSLATVVDYKAELSSKSEIIAGEKINMGKSVESSSDCIHVAAEVSDTKFEKVSNSVSTEKTNGTLFSAAPSLTNLSQLPSTPISPTFREKSVPQNEQVSPIFKAGSEALYASGFPPTAEPKLGMSNATVTDISERSKDKVVKTLKDGELSSAFGNSTSSGLSTSTSSGLSVFGVSRNSTLNNDITSTTPTSSLPAAPVTVSDATFRLSFSSGIGDMPSSTITTSTAPSAVTSSAQKNDSGNLVAEPIKSSVFSVSGPAELGTSNALSSTSSNSSALLVPTSISSSSSTLPASALFSTASVSSAISSSAISTSSNGLFNFGSSPESGGANSFFLGNSSHSSATSGTTTGSTFSTQPTQSEIGNSSTVSSLSSMTSGSTFSIQSVQNAAASSSSSFGSSAPMKMFGSSGTGTSSSGSASSLFSFSAPSSSSLVSSSGFSFPTVTGSSSNSSSSSTLTTPTSFGSSSGFPFSSSGSSSSHASATAFGSNSFSFSTSASLPTSSTGNVSFGAGAGTALFGSTSQIQSSVSGPIFGSMASSPSTGFSFGSASGSGSAPFTFGASSGAGFSFASVGSTTSSTSLHVQPMFGASNQIAGLNSGSPGNDQMNVEESMADDSVQASVQPISAFGQPNTAPAPPNFMFSAPTAPGGMSTFQFGNQQNNFIPQMQSPFQPAGNLEFAGGGSFSWGSGDNKPRKIVKVRRDKHRKK